MTDKFFTILAWCVAIPSTFLVIVTILTIIVFFTDPRHKLTIDWKFLLPWILCGISYGWIFR